MTNTKNKIALLSVAALSTIAIGMNTNTVKADEISSPNTYQKKLDNLKEKSKELNQKISDLEKKQKKNLNKLKKIKKQLHQLKLKNQKFH